MTAGTERKEPHGYQRLEQHIYRKANTLCVCYKICEVYSNELTLHYKESGQVGLRAYASGAVGHGFAPWPRHTKGVKNGTCSSLADARIKRVVLGR